jgi:hypothetical protein
MMAPSLDLLEARQLLNASPLHSHAEPLRHHRAAFVEKARHAQYAPTRISAAAATPDGDTSGFSVASTPSAPGVELTATAAIADNDVWAVGGLTAEHFNGKSWSIVPTPTVTGVGPTANVDGSLFGVAAAASNDVWAVGSQPGNQNPTFGEQLIEHWNGTAWSVVTSPEVQGDNLRGVTVVSSNNVWAVGDRSEQGFENALIEHWDGTAWSIVPDSSIAGAAAGTGLLLSVSADASNDVWAVGGETLLHFNGTTWSEVPSPLLSAKSVTALSPTNAWAVGTIEVFIRVGVQHHLKGVAEAQIEDWDGTSWSIVSSPNAGLNSSLNGIAAISANDIVAVGTLTTSSTGTTGTLIEQWNGTSWTIISSPSPGGRDNTLSGVTDQSDGTVVAVGFQENSDGSIGPLILQN